MASPPSEPLQAEAEAEEEEVLLLRANVVVLTYGRSATKPQPAAACDQLAAEFVAATQERRGGGGGAVDQAARRLEALLAPGPEYKSMANYMEGVFRLELRRDLLCASHANHPDLLLLQPLPASSSFPAPNDISSSSSSSQNASSAEGSQAAPSAGPDSQKEAEFRTSDRAPLPADSAYFTTSEGKAKLLSRIRDSPSSHHDSDSSSQTDTQYLKRKKEELMKSISLKLDILKDEQTAIKNEMSLNSELGSQVTGKVESRAKSSESEKYKLHVEEIDKITSLILGLSGRLARAQNALLLIKEEAMPEEKRILEGKRDKLSEQLEEAKKLKENIDRRAVQVSRFLTKYLTDEEYVDYDHFIKMKAKLIMDTREIDDKIKLGDEQLLALANTWPNL